MKYLVTSPPVLLGHGDYQFKETTTDEALKWFEHHHKELQVAGVSYAYKPNPSHQVQVNFQLVQIMAEAVDRFIAQQQHTLGELSHHDEVLVVQSAPEPGQKASLQSLRFSLLRRLPIEHRDHELHGAAIIDIELEAVSG